MQYVDPNLPRRIDGWRSPILGMDMPIVTYGHAGHPLLLFPTRQLCRERLNHGRRLLHTRFFDGSGMVPAMRSGALTCSVTSAIGPLPIVNTPSAFVAAGAGGASFTCTWAPTTGLPSSESITVPVIVRVAAG